MFRSCEAIKGKATVEVVSGHHPVFIVDVLYFITVDGYVFDVVFNLTQVEFCLFIFLVLEIVKTSFKLYPMLSGQILFRLIFDIGMRLRLEHKLFLELFVCYGPLQVQSDLLTLCVKPCDAEAIDIQKFVHFKGLIILFLIFSVPIFNVQIGTKSDIFYKGSFNHFV